MHLLEHGLDVVLCHQFGGGVFVGDVLDGELHLLVALLLLDVEEGEELFEQVQVLILEIQKLL